jgi:thioredoxin reductase (NADPH)
MTASVAVIGAGPAGIAASVQLCRLGIGVVVIERGRVGGLLREAQCVENFPGVPGGAPGRVLAARLRRQLASSGAALEAAEALRLSYHGGRFEIVTGKRRLAAERVILACGTTPLPPAPPLDCGELAGRVFTGVLPLLRTRGQTIAVVGGGDAAFDYALSLAARHEVHVLVRTPGPRALPLLVERCRRHPAISIHAPCRLAGVEAGRGKAPLILRVVEARGGATLACDRVLSAIGRRPALGLLDEALLAAAPGLAALKRLFVVGDAANGRLRQAAIAAADGLRAALEIQTQEVACR